MGYSRSDVRGMGVDVLMRWRPWRRAAGSGSRAAARDARWPRPARPAPRPRRCRWNSRGRASCARRGCTAITAWPWASPPSLTARMRKSASGRLSPVARSTARSTASTGTVADGRLADLAAVLVTSLTDAEALPPRCEAACRCSMRHGPGFSGSRPERQRLQVAVEDLALAVGQLLEAGEHARPCRLRPARGPAPPGAGAARGGRNACPAPGGSCGKPTSSGRMIS